MFEATQKGLITSAHDCSEGGILVAAAEMAFGGGLGLDLQLKDESLCFSETPSRYLLEVQPEKIEQLQQIFEGMSCEIIGMFNESPNVTLGTASWNIDDLFRVWSEGMVI